MSCIQNAKIQFLVTLTFLVGVEAGSEPAVQDFNLLVSCVFFVLVSRTCHVRYRNRTNSCAIWENEMVCAHLAKVNRSQRFFIIG